MDRACLFGDSNERTFSSDLSSHDASSLYFGNDLLDSSEGQSCLAPSCAQGPTASYAMPVGTSRYQAPLSAQGVPLAVTVDVLSGLPVDALLRQVPVCTQGDSSQNVRPSSLSSPSAQPIQNLIPYLTVDDSRLSADVINLSGFPLSGQQIHALDESLKFRQTPKDIPFVQLIAGIECAARELEGHDPE